MAIILDIETYAHDCASDFVEKPDLAAIKPAASLKDPEKVAASILERQRAATAAYQESLNRAALDWNLSRIVCLGLHEPDKPEPFAWICRDEAQEASVLGVFWECLNKSRDVIVGFNARAFDLPTIIQRSRLLGVKHPNISLARYGKGDVLDLFEELTFHDPRGGSYLMPRTLKTFARRFGIPVSDPVNGKEIAELVKAGDWEGVRSHCLSDIDLTRELAIRIGLVKPWRVAVA